MIAGVPGVGISGIFYLLCAFIMPFKEFYNKFKGKSTSRRRRVVRKQFGIMCGIMSSCWLTGLALGAMIVFVSKKTVCSVCGISHSNVFRIQPLFLSLITLFIVFTLVRIWNFYRDQMLRYKKGTKFGFLTTLPRQSRKKVGTI